EQDRRGQPYGQVRVPAGGGGQVVLPVARETERRDVHEQDAQHGEAAEDVERREALARRHWLQGGGLPRDRRHFALFLVHDASLRQGPVGKTQTAAEMAHFFLRRQTRLEAEAHGRVDFGSNHGGLYEGEEALPAPADSPQGSDSPA